MDKENLTYTKLSDAEYKVKSYSWKTAIGLQKVDNLVPSKYLINLANENISGNITLDGVNHQLKTYYQNKPPQNNEENHQKEADLVSMHITELLQDNSFSLSTVSLLTIHNHLFTDIFDFAGQFRTHNISKKEWVLGDRSVNYGDHRSITELVDYDINQEREFKYKDLEIDDLIIHFAKFISNIWQIHPFAEGNTRTIAVFAIKYLRTLGFNTDNDLFEKKSLYFRNALVRANFTDLQNRIFETYEPLINFFKNLLLDGKNILSNHKLYIGNDQK